MDSVAMAQELALLVKDNLSCKHLVLSAEEAFIAFLDRQETSSIGNVLILEPMSSYHRMLLHRLAEIFRLAHQSVGEGDGRRLVLERSEDSCVPGVLVSDLLHCNAVSNAFFPNTPLILKRNKEAFKYSGPQSAHFSFEERQAAYLAARERIFSNDLGDSVSQSKDVAISRPRSVPVVAKRMIAHALGKRIIAEQDCKGDNENDDNGRFKTSGLDLSCAGPLSSRDSREPSVMERACCSVNASDVNSPEEPPKAVDFHQIKAAKRMFAQALGLGSLKPISTLSKEAEKKSLDAGGFQDGEVHMGLDGGPVEKMKSGCSSSNCEQAALAQHEQGKAAQRMLVQALGFRSLSIVSERPNGA